MPKLRKVEMDEGIRMTGNHLDYKSLVPEPDRQLSFSDIRCKVQQSFVECSLFLKGVRIPRSPTQHQNQRGSCIFSHRFHCRTGYFKFLSNSLNLLFQGLEEELNHPTFPWVTSVRLLKRELINSHTVSLLSSSESSATQQTGHGFRAHAAK